MSKDRLVILRNSLKHLGAWSLNLEFSVSKICAEVVSALHAVCVEACVDAMVSGMLSRKIEVMIELDEVGEGGFDDKHDQMEGVCAALKLTMQSLRRLPGMCRIDFEAKVN